jgi:hypothetical protein
MTLFRLGHTGVDSRQLPLIFGLGQRVVKCGTIDLCLKVIDEASPIRRIHYFIPRRSSFPPLVMVWHCAGQAGC